jgi:hypothetical protein
MGVTTTQTNKPFSPRGNDQSPLAFNRAKLYSGKALDFDGVNDEIDLDGFTMSGNTASFAFYLKADNWNASGFIFDSRTNRLSIGGDSANANTLNIRSGISWRKLADISDTTNTNHFVITIDGTAAKLFLNGQSFGYEVTLSSEIDLSSNANTAIMSYSAGTSSYFNGKLSGFKIFNTALTAAQVADLYNNPEKVVPTGVANTALKLWLPMQEGAGTTAYDGSGNGNHGTISGATYTHGIGAPVSQTAVISWNKGTNLLANTDINNAYWTKSGGTLTTGIEAPDGTNTAFKFERDDSSSGTIYSISIPGLDQDKYRYVYAKLPSGSASASAQLLSYNTNTNNTFTITDQWQRFEADSSPQVPANFYIVDFRAGVGVDEIHLWAPQATATNNPSVFVPTIGTAQSSEVLLPQGLTTGRDITGVNLFENVRKQGALNLDGNSWAEVHDNESLDITSAITLEAWVYWDTGLDEGFVSKWNLSQNKASYLLYKASASRFMIYVSSDGSSILNQQNVTNISSGWNHLVGVYDGANLKCYLNGVLDGSRTYSSGLFSTDVPIEIGRYSESAATTYGNQIAQPRIYNRALTAAEVLQNYNSGKNTYK